MSIPIYFVIISIFVGARIDGKTTTPTCQLNLKSDFGIPSPVLIYKNKYLEVNPAGSIEVPHNESVTIACPGKRTSLVLENITQSFDEANFNCQSGQTFHAGNWTGLFKDIQCRPSPYFSVEETKERCADRHNIFRVGYKTGKKFYSLYEACFDCDLLTTLYVKHTVTPGSYYVQNGGGRPSFVSGDMFGKVRVSDLYKVAKQKERLVSLLGEAMDEKYITKKQFLNRGHLAPRADFSLRAPQHASFHYVNAAPQWSRFNAGDWAALEEAIRRRSKETKTTLTVYTGTYKVLTLMDKTGNQQEIFLTTDENNNNVVPVPLYFYKVVYDPRTKRATAFISINSSYYDQKTEEKLTFCEDICAENPAFKWLRWRNDGTHSFCCSYEDFAKEIRLLPHLDVHGVFS